MENIKFVNFDSELMNLSLIERDMPTPEEKEVIEDIPFRQGVLDFSSLTGERIFTNRNGTYQFKAFREDYPNRKILEQKVKQLAMMGGIAPLYDSHDAGFYWLGKCIEVTVEDDAEYNELIVNMEFSLYPFMFAVEDFLEDVFDDIQINHHAILYNHHAVNGEKIVTLYNWGDRALFPIMEVEVY